MPDWNGGRHTTVIVSASGNSARVALTLWITGAGVLFAGIRPSFYLEHSSWHATHIVVVRTTEKDAVFRVIESWKGDLPEGEHVVVPELIPPAHGRPISAYPEIDFTHIFDAVPSHLDFPRQRQGSRMVLFLRRTVPAVPGTESSTSREWDPASSMGGGFKTSVVWIEGDDVYAFVQVMNPGPSILTPLGISVSQIKDRVAQIVSAQQELESAADIADGYAKAERLKHYLDSDVLPVRQAALSELGKCGPAALPAIREMLDDAAFADEASEIVHAYVAAGRDAVGEDLNMRLRRELDFWKATGPSLVQGWWVQTPEAEKLRDRYLLTLELVLALQKTRYAEAVYTATELRDFWRAFPQLNDRGGLNQMAEECDALITHLRSK